MIIIPKQASWVAYALLSIFLVVGTVALVVLKPEMLKGKIKGTWNKVSF